MERIDTSIKDDIKSQYISTIICFVLVNPSTFLLHMSSFAV